MSAAQVRPRTSWVDVPAGSDFTIYNLPYGVFSLPSSSAPRCGVAIGDSILDLAAISHLLHCVQGLDARCFSESSLNAFMAHPSHVWSATRARLTALLEDGPLGSRDLRDSTGLCQRALVPRSAAQMHLPAEVADYTDFFASREHAFNCGCLFRSPENALQPNWLHLPVGYHGRASTVCVSGTPIVRPQGQLQKDKTNPSLGSFFAPSQMLDFECEIGVFLGGEPNAMGAPVRMQDAPQRIFGLVLLNDWSARDIQAWE